jgi:fucose permease
LNRALPLATFVVLGLPAGAVGVAWPPMRASFGAPLAGLGLLLAAVTVGYAAGAAFSGPLALRFGGAALVVSGCTLDAAGLLGISLAPQWWMIPVCGLPIGFGAGFVDGAVNTYVSLTRGVRYMSWLHASWAVGAAVAPQIVVVSLALSGSWRPAFAVAASCFVLCAIGIAAQRHEWSRLSEKAAPASSSREPASTGYVRAVVFLAALLFLAAGLEATTGDWSYTQLTLGRSIAAAVASWGATLFWAGLAGGRVVLGIVGHRFEPERFLDAGIALSALAAVLYWLAPPLAATFIALPLVGIAVSVIFPLLLSLTPSRVGTTFTGRAVGYGLAAGTIGGGALPAVIGLVLQQIGLFTLGPTMAIMAVALLLLHAVSRGEQRSAQRGRGRLAS